ncbi:MAG: cytochrome d ubiquinol oxidase subunit II [Pseudomonadota bacterium]
MPIENLWFVLVAFMLAMYAVFDGFDLGVGALHLWVARSNGDRKMTIRSIGPVWDGNEVWLLAAGGTLYFAFPGLYASGFSGLYLALMLVLWLLILRGVAVEFRSHVIQPIWIRFWDVVFSLSSLLLALFFGVALGNVVRGVPLDAHGWFFVPLWTDFDVGPNPGILDWYTVLAGLAAVVAAVHHASLWLILKTEGAVEARARQAAAWSWWALITTGAALTAATFYVQPQIVANLHAYPWGAVFPLCALAALLVSRILAHRGKASAAFLASSKFLAFSIASAAFGIYPMVLPASTGADMALTVHNVAAPVYGLKVGLYWWIPGMLLVTAYFVYTYWNFTGKVRSGEPGY